MPHRVLVVLAFACATAHAQPARVQALDWMSGTWVHEADGARVTETWLGPANGLMVAANLSAGPGARKFFEFLRIADTAEGISYYASPAGRPPTEFKLKTLAERRVVFENPDKDFPRRILYWRDGERLRARIEGEVNGSAKSEEWSFAPAGR